MIRTQLRRAGLATAALAVTGGITLAAAPAHAAADLAARCADGHFCAFDGNNYQGKIFDERVRPGRRYDLRSDKTNSMINNSDYKVCVYNEHLAWDDLIWRVHPGERVPSMGGQYNKADYIAVRKDNERCPA